MKYVLATVIALAVILPVQGAITTYVTPNGDGQSGKDRYGSFSGWESSDFEADANPNWAGHWYDSYSYSGSYRDVYLQVSLGDIPTDADIVAASLNLYITDIGGSGADVYHREDNSTTTGLASQKLTGSQLVAQASDLALGWNALDVTSYITADVAEGYDWVAFYLPHKGYSSLAFASADGDSDYVPYLSVILADVSEDHSETPSAPVPSSLALAAVACGGLRIMRRRK